MNAIFEDTYEMSNFNNQNFVFVFFLLISLNCKHILIKELNRNIKIENPAQIFHLWVKKMDYDFWTSRIVADYAPGWTKLGNHLAFSSRGSWCKELANDLLYDAYSSGSEAFAAPSSGFPSRWAIFILIICFMWTFFLYVLF
jgi:hypothetical protein